MIPRPPCTGTWYEPVPEVPELATIRMVCRRLGISRQGLYDLRRTDPTFPLAVALTSSDVRFRGGEVEEWIARHLAERNEQLAKLPRVDVAKYATRMARGPRPAPSTLCNPPSTDVPPHPSTNAEQEAVSSSCSARPQGGAA